MRLIDKDMLSVADQNRQVWTAVNELLDQLAVFAEKDHLSLQELCLMLESSISAKTAAAAVSALSACAASACLAAPQKSRQSISSTADRILRVICFPFMPRLLFLNADTRQKSSEACQREWRPCRRRHRDRYGLHRG